MPWPLNFGPARDTRQDLGVSSSVVLIDLRRQLSANYVRDLPIKSGNRWVNNVIGGWQLAGTFFLTDRAPVQHGKPSHRERTCIDSATFFCVLLCDDAARKGRSCVRGMFPKS